MNNHIDGASDFARAPDTNFSKHFDFKRNRSSRPKSRVLRSTARSNGDALPRIITRGFIRKMIVLIENDPLRESETGDKDGERFDSNTNDNSHDSWNRILSQVQREKDTIAPLLCPFARHPLIIAVGSHSADLINALLVLLHCLRTFKCRLKQSMHNDICVSPNR